MTVMNIGPGGKLFSQADPEWKEWRDQRNTRFIKGINTRLADGVDLTKEQLVQIAAELEEPLHPDLAA